MALGGSIGREDWSAWFNSTEWSFEGLWMLLGEYLSWRECRVKLYRRSHVR